MKHPANFTLPHDNPAQPTPARGAATLIWLCAIGWLAALSPRVPVSSVAGLPTAAHLPRGGQR